VSGEQEPVPGNGYPFPEDTKLPPRLAAVGPGCAKGIEKSPDCPVSGQQINFVLFHGNLAPLHGNLALAMSIY
jgi:hypothetical protein